ncbi:protein MIZU-KUSSEI 1 [Benincasa hispida]|uniref:protein MIZU-KUSSEI 1 n=1 Tax=Benincasa hispida TaxID=102211 RepID=UPI0018FF1390|nr:protein MIZU-KUSSEI 1 [Benincasa hispida]
MKQHRHLELSSLGRSTSSTDTAIVPKPSYSTTSSHRPSSLLHSLFHFLLHRRNALSLVTLPRKLTGTLFGHRHGHVTFSLQLDPRSEPLTLLHLHISTTTLLTEMSSGVLRIALHSHKLPGRARPTKLLQHPSWTMYCNGTESGLALSRTCEAYDRHVLNTIRSVSVGAGVIPVLHDGTKAGAGCSELGALVYMRAEFERVVGSADSEALFMINPDGNAASELTIFLLRI